MAAGIGDQPCHSDRNERPGVACPDRLEQLTLLRGSADSRFRNRRPGDRRRNHVIVGFAILFRPHHTLDGGPSNSKQALSGAINQRGSKRAGSEGPKGGHSSAGQGRRCE